jgi:hypothetical protein
MGGQIEPTHITSIVYLRGCVRNTNLFQYNNNNNKTQRH